MNTARVLYRPAPAGIGLVTHPAPHVSTQEPALDSVLQRPDVWRGRFHAPQGGHVPTGHGALDETLPGGGWPQGALTELLVAHTGIGELGLLMPALAALSRGEHWIAWIGAPHLPYAPALAAAGLRLGRLLLIQPATAKEGLWATEQTLRSGACAAVLAWPERPDERALRRLQLAAEEGGAIGFLFRPGHAARHASPAALRLALAPGDGELIAQILKCRGGWSRHAVHLPRDCGDGHTLIDGQNAEGAEARRTRRMD
ncbi:MAG: translesion DNA synthesis-associated protein ImuA [Gammaproteobacteria bacterium]|nr:translesion DNA synthesis-associated protein ImuA [Gammaproteobacteria bacterium]